MSTSISVNNNSNSVSIENTANQITVVSNSQEQTVVVPQNVTSVVQVLTGPRGGKGDQGEPGTANTASFATTGSNTLIGTQIVSGSLEVSGSLTVGGALVLTSQDTSSLLSETVFNSFTSSYVSDSSSFDTRIAQVSNSAVSTSSFNAFVATYNTGSFLGQLEGTASWAHSASAAVNAETASFLPLGNYNITSSWAQNASQALTASYLLEGTYSITASWAQSASNAVSSQTASFLPVGTYNVTASWAESASNAVTAQVALSAPDYVLISATSSMLAPYALTSDLAHFATTSSNSFVGNQTITGSVTITQNLTVLGSSSIFYITSSQLDVGINTISVNVAEPGFRFGGLLVYDSGSLSHQATASLLWDSQNNHWVYQNASGSTYSGGMLISGPRNTGSLGDERAPLKDYVLKGQGGDHLIESSIFDDGTKVSISSSVDVTGSLIATSGITGSLFGTSSWAVSSSNSVNAQTASFLALGTYSITSSWSISASQAITASYIDPAFISQSAAAAGFSSGTPASLAIAYAIALG